jgi:hypothetical protein
VARSALDDAQARERGVVEVEHCEAKPRKREADRRIR